MPKIPDRIIDSVFFLYASMEDAMAGKNPGGTGFVVKTGRNLWTGDGSHFYGVTNWHVACQQGASVVRLNTIDGGVDVKEFGPEDWEFIPSGPDVAVVPLSLVPHDCMTLRCMIPSVSIGDFARKSMLDRDSRDCLSVGDDVVMLGLFVDHNGLTTNVPSARFGNISMLASPAAPIKQQTGFLGQSYVVDMHSRTGFSGSPVFVFRTFGSDLTTDEHEIEGLHVDEDIRGAKIEVRTLFYFLGIHWGQFPERWELRNKSSMLEVRKPHLITEGTYVEGMSGMTCVIPSWDIEQVLNLPKLQRMRETDVRAR